MARRRRQPDKGVTPRGIRTTRLKPFMCFACGHMMDAASSLTAPDDAPGEGDLAACINCAAVAELRGGSWVRFTNWGRLTPEERRDVTLHQTAIRAMHGVVGRPGDSKREGMA